MTLFKSNADAACAKQAAAHIAAINVQVFLTSTAINPVREPSSSRDPAHAVRAHSMLRTAKAGTHARVPARIPCLGPVQSYTGVCWRSILAVPASAIQDIVSIMLFERRYSFARSVANIAQSGIGPSALPSHRHRSYSAFRTYPLQRVEVVKNVVTK